MRLCSWLDQSQARKALNRQVTSIMNREQGERERERNKRGDSEERYRTHRYIHRTWIYVCLERERGSRAVVYSSWKFGETKYE